jgi:DNA (cytosine-5)-methyltransferase 1
MQWLLFIYLRMIDATEQLASVFDAAKILGTSPDTIRRWEKKGLIKCERSKNGHRLFRVNELQRTQQKYLGGESSGGKFQILKSKPTNHNVIELFAGCGGLALGFKNAGLKSELLVEIEKDCVATLKKNLPNIRSECTDVANIDFRPWKNKVDIVSGGFPCQAFSYAGQGLGFGETRGTLFFQFARCVEEVRPKIAVGENVRGLLMHDNGRTLQTMVGTLEDLGYTVYTRLLRAQFLDVPQKRERLFIIALDKSFSHPAFFPRERDYTVSLREALADCPPSPGQKYPEKKAKIMALIPPGGYWRDLPPELQRSYMGASFHHIGGRTGMARRLSWDEPSLTLTCNPAQKQTERGHPKENRPLSVREYARIQTFPDRWQFHGSTSSQYRQIGNAVPVNLGYHVGRCLIAMLEGKIDQKTMIVHTEEKKSAFQSDFAF